MTMTALLSAAPAALVSAADAAPLTTAGSTQLILAALIGIAVIVLLITQLKLHPFLSLKVIFNDPEYLPTGSSTRSSAVPRRGACRGPWRSSAP